MSPEHQYKQLVVTVKAPLPDQTSVSSRIPWPPLCMPCSRDSPLVAADDSVGKTLGSCNSPFPTHLPMSPGRLSQTVSHHLPGSDKGPGFLPTLFSCSCIYKTAEKQLEIGSPATGPPFIRVVVTCPFRFGVPCTRATFAYSSF